MCWARELWADNGDSPFGNGLEITLPPGHMLDLRAELR